ncbi:hypothetical protein K493DRAFT_303140 [Basidiobolus meristosporus CBS 931.73]|uniref:Uncharacterized protein n=1 Tax=Basidiobolus meristosporus CBS 931.73 TaxID=1314790 RepID=A0A1Y1Y4S2_9FUNG|nr:hypothetical protein K493DRAFT_303140 [Basidiobolus meristosporus CBS 931.73]|eukprot:ORX92726.1 hypothetical protein K493DRAFT_303140 [Basidiobolus meristosporus CBS 931.73]
MSYLHVKRAIEALSNPVVVESLVTDCTTTSTSTSTPTPTYPVDFLPNGDSMDYQYDRQPVIPPPTQSLPPVDTSIHPTPTRPDSPPEPAQAQDDPERKVSNRKKKRKIILNSASGQLW